jgi:hypothetical protein
VYQAVLARALARSGQVCAAREIVHRLTTNGARVAQKDVTWYLAMVCLADAAELTQASEAALSLEPQLAPYTGRLATTWTTMTLPVDIARSQLALAAGHKQDAHEFATRALTLSRSIDAPIFVARALILQATCLRDLGLQTEDVVRDALSIADQTGAALVRHEAIRYGLV